MLLLPFPRDHPKNPEAEFCLPVQQQKAEPRGWGVPCCGRGDSLYWYIFFKHGACWVWFVCIYFWYVAVSRQSEHQCVLSLLALTFFGLVNIIDGVSFTSWNSGYFFCYVILILKPCKQRANTIGTRVNTLVCIWMSICMGPLFPAFMQMQTHTCEWVWKREQKIESKRELDSWKRLFSLIYPVPFLSSTGQEFKKLPTPSVRCILV